MNDKNGFAHSIKLRALRVDDYQIVLTWSKDDNFCSANGWDRNRDEKELYNWWLRCVNNEAKNFLRTGILLDDKLVGYADLAHIKNNEAELGIAIGESDLWGKGIGTSAVLCMMKYASEHLEIIIFNAETHEANTRSRKMLQNLGFVEISRIGTEEYLGIDDTLIQHRLESPSFK